jgi:hypothetical protein
VRLVYDPMGMTGLTTTIPGVDGVLHLASPSPLVGYGAWLEVMLVVRLCQWSITEGIGGGARVVL